MHDYGMADSTSSSNPLVIERISNFPQQRAQTNARTSVPSKLVQTPKKTRNRSRYRRSRRRLAHFPKATGPAPGKPDCEGRCFADL